MEKFNQQIVWVELNVDNVKQNLERQQAIQKSKKQNWNNCKKNSYCRCSERFHKIYTTGKERWKSAMQIFFGNLKWDLQHYLKEFPLPRARSPLATAFECIDMIELQMSISVYTHFLTHAFCQGTVPMTRQENHSGNSQKKISIC